MPAEAVKRRVLWLAVFLPFTILALRHVPEGPRFIEEDYAHYLLHAEAIANGRAYTDIGFISTPLNAYIGPIAMPPGVPTLLAPVVALGGVHSPLIPLVMIAVTLAFLVAAAAYFARREPVSIAMAVGLLCGLQPDLLHFTTQALSDLPLAAALWGVILLTEPEEGPWSVPRLTAITLLGAAAISTRLAGIALVPAMAAFGLLHFRVQRFRPVIPFLFWIATFQITSALIPTTASMMHNVGLVPTSFLNLFRFAGRAYGLATLDAQLFPVGPVWANRIWHVLTVGLLVIGTMSAMRAYWRSFVGLFAFAYVCMLFLVPVSNLRYFYPLIPVVVFLTLRGAVVVVRALRPRMEASRVPVMIAGAAAVVAAASAIAVRNPRPPSAITLRPEVIDLYASLRRLPASPSPRVMAFRPRILALEMGIPAMPLVKGEPEVIIRELCALAITHVVLGDMGSHPVEMAAVRRAVASYPGAFTEEFRNKSFAVMRFDPTRAGAALGGAACARRPARER